MNRKMTHMLRRYFERTALGPIAPITHTRAVQNSDTSHYREAAVLIPVHLSGKDSSILLTLRTAHLRSHAGQISFPGGTKELCDTSAIDTALRESEEEIGLAHHEVEVLGRLGSFSMPSGYTVTPVVGLVPNIAQLRACPNEVEKIIHLPLDTALDTKNYKSVPFTRDGITHQVWELYIGSHRVWGATASILYHLASELSNEA